MATDEGAATARGTRTTIEGGVDSMLQASAAAPDAKSPDTHDRQPLQAADEIKEGQASQKSSTAVQAALQSGGKLLLHLAASKRNDAASLITNTLLRCGDQCANVCDSEGFTPLALACRRVDQL
eukprot:6176496-Pleurochrysis_carterae.AAC.2